jgi:hypothetical protein
MSTFESDPAKARILSTNRSVLVSDDSSGNRMVAMTRLLFEVILENEFPPLLNSMLSAG